MIFSCKALEIAELRKSLEEAKHGYKTYEDCLLITKIQVNQLEKQLFDLKSAKTHVNDILLNTLNLIDIVMFDSGSRFGMFE